MRGYVGHPCSIIRGHQRHLVALHSPSLLLNMSHGLDEGIPLLFCKLVQLTLVQLIVAVVLLRQFL